MVMERFVNVELNSDGGDISLGMNKVAFKFKAIEIIFCYFKSKSILLRSITNYNKR